MVRHQRDLQLPSQLHFSLLRYLHQIGAGQAQSSEEDGALTLFKGFEQLRFTLFKLFEGHAEHFQHTADRKDVTGDDGVVPFVSNSCDLICSSSASYSNGRLLACIIASRCSNVIAARSVALRTVMSDVVALLGDSNPSSSGDVTAVFV